MINLNDEVYYHDYFDIKKKLCKVHSMLNGTLLIELDINHHRWVSITEVEELTEHEKLKLLLEKKI